MLLLRIAKNSSRRAERLKRFLSASPLTLMHRQDRAMNTIMKNAWTEAQVSGLPSGEHDFFERKSGTLLSSADFRKDVGKALSALANSGGGHLLLGVRDDGSFDGVEAMSKGRTSMRDWL